MKAKYIGHGAYIDKTLNIAAKRLNCKQEVNT